MTPSPSASRSSYAWRLKAAADIGLTDLSSGSGLVARITPAGSVFAFRHGTTLINQVLAGPLEGGLLRLILRWRSPRGDSGWVSLVEPGIAHRRTGPLSFEWFCKPTTGISAKVTLVLHETLPAWSWRVSVCNTSAEPLKVDVLHAQDLGLSDEAAVRGNEAFTSQYIDLLPVYADHIGWTILARQNQPTQEATHPWLAIACETGASGFATDGLQFFGPQNRLTGVPAAVGATNLPSVRLQHECAMACLQSRQLSLYPSAVTDVVFVGHYVPDHPEASSPGDLTLLWKAIHDIGISREAPACLDPPTNEPQVRARSLFMTAPILAGDRPTGSDLARWFPGEHRHEERSSDGEVSAFFCGFATHVVSRDKEAASARPHGHILRSGSWTWIDNEQFGTTCYAAGIFSVQAYLGNTSFGRLLPVVRDTLGLGRSAGQRVFVRVDGGWKQLGIPSAFSMKPSEARWIYRLGTQFVEARTWCSSGHPAAFLELRATTGDAGIEFLVSHTLALDVNEFDRQGEVTVDPDGQWAACEPDPACLMRVHLPGACYAIASAEPGLPVEIGGDELLFPDGASQGHPCVALRTGKVRRFGVILCGSLNGAAGLSSEVEEARREWLIGGAVAGPPAPPVRLALKPGVDSDTDSTVSAAVSRLDEILPWLAHNAAIHFSAPHGLEQQNGAAWGVRDVCQGSVEWLLSANDWPLLRRILKTVFAQQYARDGSWPQWFMHSPFQSIQHAHSHGDVAFWPVKALCDYIEASNDISFLTETVGYTDPDQFVPTGPEETLLQHCDRMVCQCEARFVDGSALVNYGDGDWDDTLQPADPAMRTRMISTWTVALAFQTFRQFAAVLKRASEGDRASRLERLLQRMRGDFRLRLMPDGVTTGFLVTEEDGRARPLIHPTDKLTGIRYRLLPMTRSILAELFSSGEAQRHMEIVNSELLYPDGARLMSEPAKYRGGKEYLFKRADTAANVGREIGLLYVHAHLRYAEALAKLGDAERLWTALQVVNPVGLLDVVANAAPRQSNVYFSSSDADFGDRVLAGKHWRDLKKGSVTVCGGWRLYSSGPGLFLHTVRASLLGVRESFSEIVFDPVLPAGLDGLSAKLTLCERSCLVKYRVKERSSGPATLIVNGAKIVAATREQNPYRLGGLCLSASLLRSLLKESGNVIEVVM